MQLYLFSKSICGSLLFNGNVFTFLTDFGTSFGVGIADQFRHVDFGLFEDFNFSDQNSAQWEDFLASFQQFSGNIVVDAFGSELGAGRVRGGFSEVFGEDLSDGSDLGMFAVCVCAQLTGFSGGECCAQNSENVTVLGFDISDNIDQSHFLFEESVQFFFDHG